ncbi:MAG: hypothetical protein KDD66_15960, partial [Bdellovibrionales bacterium]|nr:hypothetical protein [Bdellovibrionales bacterium]
TRPGDNENECQRDTKESRQIHIKGDLSINFRATQPITHWIGPQNFESLVSACETSLASFTTY